VQVFKTQLEYFCAQLLHSSTLQHSVLQHAATQQLLSAAVAYSSLVLNAYTFYSPKVAIFAEKKSKIASFMCTVVKGHIDGKH